jgi:hypothetical protein
VHVHEFSTDEPRTVCSALLHTGKMHSFSKQVRSRADSWPARSAIQITHDIRDHSYSDNAHGHVSLRYPCRA